MRTIIFSFLLIGFGLSAKAQDMNCSEFHTGKFHVIYLDNLETIIKRTATHQFEKDGKAKAKLKIHWVDDCTYTLTLVKANRAYRKELGVNFKERVLEVKITLINENSYIAESTFKGENGPVYKSKIIKVK